MKRRKFYVSAAPSAELAPIGTAAGDVSCCVYYVHHTLGLVSYDDSDETHWACFERLGLILLYTSIDHLLETRSICRIASIECWTRFHTRIVQYHPIPLPHQFHCRQDAVILYRRPARRRPCTSPSARLPLTNATVPAAATAGSIWKRFQWV